MSEPKTKLSDASVKDFLNSVDGEIRQDCWTIASMMQKATKAKPKMWGAKIVGFGIRRQKYADGSERDWMRIAFAPQKNKITLYMACESKSREQLLAKLGKFKASTACIYIKRLSDIHLPTLNKLIQESVKRA